MVSLLNKMLPFLLCYSYGSFVSQLLNLKDFYFYFLHDGVSVFSIAFVTH